MVRRQPLLSRRTGARTSRITSVPAPVGGWNARDALASMRPTDAVTMSNWFPRQSDCITRPGYSLHCDTGEGEQVTQLIEHETGTNTKLLAACNGKLIDVTTATPSSLATGLSGGDWSYAHLALVTLMANGADVVKSYNGSTVSSPAFTGVTLSTLDHVDVFKGRAYFVEQNSQSMWYGGAGAVTGALTEFDFSLVAAVEGNLCFTTHLKGDGGDGGTDDVFIAVFKGGSVLAYAGSDPGDPTDWSLIGHFQIGRPLSRLAHLRTADDVIVITDRGYEALAKMIRYGEGYRQAELFSAKIQRVVSANVDSIGSTDDWRVFVYPKGQMLMFLIPRSVSVREHHVQNINTGAWCLFEGIGAFSWGKLSGSAYFGNSNGIVYAFDDGTKNDAGTAIRADSQQAWNYLGMLGPLKHVQLIKPNMFAGATPSLSVNAGKDFNPITLSDFTAVGALDEAIWDAAIWDAETWAYGEQAFGDWFGRNALGNSIGWRIAIDSSNDRVRWYSTDLTYNVGSFI